MPPVLVLCDMEPKYKVVNAWAEAAIVEVSLAYWADGKVITITFAGQKLHILKPKEFVGKGSSQAMHSHSLLSLRLAKHPQSTRC